MTEQLLDVPNQSNLKTTAMQFPNAPNNGGAQCTWCMY